MSEFVDHFIKEIITGENLRFVVGTTVTAGMGLYVATKIQNTFLVKNRGVKTLDELIERVSDLKFQWHSHALAPSLVTWKKLSSEILLLGEDVEEIIKWLNKNKKHLKIVSLENLKEKVDDLCEAYEIGFHKAKAARPHEIRQVMKSFNACIFSMEDLSLNIYKI